MAIDNFTGKNIQDTYQRVVQTDGVRLADGTGSLLPISFEGDDVIIPGALKAQSYIVSESVVNVSSGSTKFGDSADDSHSFTGKITGSSTMHIGGKTGIGVIPSSVYGLNVEGGININSTPATSPLHITQLVPDGQYRFGTITLPSDGKAVQPHFRTSGESGVAPAIYLGDANEAVIYGVDQENNDVWNINQEGIFSGICNRATSLTASVHISASGVITATQGFGTIDGGTF